MKTRPGIYFADLMYATGKLDYLSSRTNNIIVITDTPSDPPLMEYVELTEMNYQDMLH